LAKPFVEKGIKDSIKAEPGPVKGEFVKEKPRELEKGKGAQKR